MSGIGRTGYGLVALAAFACLALGGCLGKPSPVEEYLRVLGQGGGCAASANVQPGAASGQNREIVAVKTFKASESLDRQAVMLAAGRVLTPSLRWYWEASPGPLSSQAIAGELNCSSRLAAVWPMRSGTKAAKVLAGQVTAFEVQTQGMQVRIAVRCQLWDGEETKVLAVRDFEAVAPVAELTSQAVAGSGASALATLSGQIRAWVELIGVPAGTASVQ